MRQFRVHRDVVARRMGDRAVLVHLGTNGIFELNDTGARIWELIRDHSGIEPVVQQLVAEFHVDRVQAERDVRELVDRLTAAGLLES